MSPTRIVVAARKGGVGKSSMVAGLASVYAAAGRRVLAVDLDPQSNLAFMLGGDPTAPGTAALLDGQRPTPQELAPNLYVLPGGPELARRDIARLDPEDLADALEGEPWEVILFDAPPGSEHLERLGVVAADVALVVTNAHPIAVIGAGRVLEDLESRLARGRRGPGRWAVVMNMIDARRTLDRNMEHLLAHVPEAVPRFMVRQDIHVAMATAQGVGLASYAPASPALASLNEIQEWCDGPQAL